MGRNSFSLQKTKIAKSKKLLLLGIFLLMIIAVLVWEESILHTEDIITTVKNTDCASQNSIIQESGVGGQSLLLLDKSNIKKKLMDKFFCIKEVNFQISFPSKLKMDIIGREPIARVVAARVLDPLILSTPDATPSSSAVLFDWSFPDNAQEKSFFVDNSGLVYSESQRRDLPLFFLPVDNIKLGQKLANFSFEKIAQAIFSLKDLGLPINKIKVINKLMFVETQPRIIFSLDEDILKQTASLQLILQKSKINGRMIQFVDLRFEKPIIVY